MVSMVGGREVERSDIYFRLAYLKAIVDRIGTLSIALCHVYYIYYDFPSLINFLTSFIQLVDKLLCTNPTAQWAVSRRQIQGLRLLCS